MSVIGKKSLIHDTLTRLTGNDLVRFESLLNHKIENPIDLSFSDIHYSLKEEHKGVNYVRYYLDDLRKIIICGFLCYIDDSHCALFGLTGATNEQMLSIKIDPVNKKYEILDEGLDIDELRREIYDITTVKTGGDFNIHSLSETLEGSDTIVVDLNEQGSKIAFKLDETYKDHIEEGMAHEISIDNVPETATNGQLEEEDYLILVNYPRSTIMFNHERYYPMDLGHEEGYLGYSHIGFENGVFMIKHINITQSNRTWVLNTIEIGGN